MASFMAQCAISTEEMAIRHAIASAEAATAHNKPSVALKERKKRIGKEKAADTEADGKQAIPESEARKREGGAKPKRKDSGIDPGAAEATVSVVTTYTLVGAERTKTFEIAAQPRARRQRAWSMVSSTVVWSVDGSAPEQMLVHASLRDQEEGGTADKVLCDPAAGERRRTLRP